MSIFSKNNRYVEMCKQQYEEMFDFYLSLGYTEKQAKRLSSSCFGADIEVSEKSGIYRADWSFYRRMRRNDDKTNRGFFGIRSMSKSSRCAEGAVCMDEPLEDMCAPMPVMAAPMMNMKMAEPAEPEFNTAETNNAPEIEEAGPLDRPQMIFSANVNTASWCYLRDKIKQCQRIDKSFVRIEEIINSYPYEMKPPEDDELFALSFEHGRCPWSEDGELLMVGLKGRKSEKEVHQNLAFLVDVSGSMEDEWVLAQMSIAAIVSKLKKGDYMSVIAYSDNTVTVAKKMKCDNLDDCVNAILSIDGIGGCTNGSRGLEDAYQYLSDNFDENANNRVFIFTDGDFNFGITGESGLSDFIYEKRKSGIYLSIVGYGRNNFKDNKMEALARNGNGNYTFVTNPADIKDNLWDKLVSNLVTVAKDVKISVELNPRYAKKYRLIGYDARVLTQKEFNDTEKAVDGIGSEHNVAALIQFTRGTAQKAYPTRYVTTESSGCEDEFAFIEIHYKTPDDENKVMTRAISIQELENAGSKNMPVITMLAAFGLVVKQSEYKGTADNQMISELLDEIEKDESINTRVPYSHFDIVREYVQGAGC